MAVVLAWLLQRSPNILLIPGTRSLDDPIELALDRSVALTRDRFEAVVIDDADQTGAPA
jgi:aryl-alcohol dehydrogenase-like predicted oxidoreductase